LAPPSTLLTIMDIAASIEADAAATAAVEGASVTEKLPVAVAWVSCSALTEASTR
jgi:hypothetical protein